MARDCCRKGALFIIHMCWELDSKYNTQPPVHRLWVTAFPAKTWPVPSWLEVFAGRLEGWVPDLQCIRCPTPSGFSDISQPFILVSHWGAAPSAPILPCSLQAVCRVLSRQDGRAAGGVGCQQPVPLCCPVPPLSLAHSRPPCRWQPRRFACPWDWQQPAPLGTAQPTTALPAMTQPASAQPATAQPTTTQMFACEWFFRVGMHYIQGARFHCPPLLMADGEQCGSLRDPGRER